MNGVNKVILLGNLGSDPDVRYTADGTAVASVSVATTRSYKDSSGEKKEETEWHRVVFFGKVAEIVSDYLRKGSSVYVEGRLRTRKWTDKNGVERYTTEIVSENMQMLGQKPEGQKSDGQKPSRQNRPSKKDDGIAGMDDDIPF